MAKFLKITHPDGTIHHVPFNESTLNYHHRHNNRAGNIAAGKIFGIQEVEGDYDHNSEHGFKVVKTGKVHTESPKMTANSQAEEIEKLKAELAKLQKGSAKPGETKEELEAAIATLEAKGGNLNGGEQKKLDGLKKKLAELQ